MMLDNKDSCFVAHFVFTQVFLRSTYVGRLKESKLGSFYSTITFIEEHSTLLTAFVISQHREPKYRQVPA